MTYICIIYTQLVRLNHAREDHSLLMFVCYMAQGV